MRIFLDANILFSAGNEKSNLHCFLVWLTRKDHLMTNSYAKAEAERNLLNKRPEWREGFLTLAGYITIVPNELLHEDIILSEKDRPILGSAIAARCDYLLTGDKRDFGHLYGKTIAGVKVVDYVMLVKAFL